MKPTTKFGLKYVGVLLTAMLAGFGILFSSLALLVMPLVRWLLGDSLYFPTSRNELTWLALAVVAVSLIGTVGMWLEGKLRGRY